MHPACRFSVSMESNNKTHGPHNPFSPYPDYLHKRTCPSQALRSPEPHDSLGDANIIRLKRVQGRAGSQRRKAQGPHEELADAGDAFRREVVDDAGPGARVSSLRHTDAEEADASFSADEGRTRSQCASGRPRERTESSR